MTRVVSFVISVILTLQLAASFDLFPRFLSRPSHFLWPVMNYPMYSSAHYDLGLNFRKFQDLTIAALRDRDVRRAAAFAEIYRVRMGTRLVAMRLERDGYVLTRDGLQPAPPVRLSAVLLQAQ